MFVSSKNIRRIFILSSYSVLNVQVWQKHQKKMLPDYLKERSDVELLSINTVVQKIATLLLNFCRKSKPEQVSLSNF